jgi:PAS domain S-box-containing protein
MSGLLALEMNRASTVGVAGLSAYLEAALDCVIMADPSGCIVEFNPAAERTFGYTREEALGHRLAELIVPPSLRERHNLAFARFIATGEERLFGQRLELTGMRADGSEFPVELALSRVKSEPLLICGALRDLSDPKRAEEDLRLLADEQTALRQVATLVARGAGPAEVFAAVAEGVATVLGVPAISMIRFESDGTATKIAGWGKSPFAIGTRWTLDDPSVMASVMQTGRPARIDDYESVVGAHAKRVRAGGIRSGIGAPIVVDGKCWGVIVAFSTDPEPLSVHSEARLARFTELVETAISNTQARDDLQNLVDEQTALRRVATLVAREARQDEIFAAVAEESARLLDVALASVLSFEPDGASNLIGTSGPQEPFAIGDRYPPHPGVVADVWRTGRPTTVDYADVSGEMAARLVAAGMLSGLGVPIVVDGRTWGVVVALSTKGHPLPENAESRLVDFTELVATAISNANARDDLRLLLSEQAALRRVATLVARGADPPAVFDAVCEETGRLLGATSTNLACFTSDGFNVTMAGWSLRNTHVPTGTRLPLTPDTINGVIQHTGAPARVDSYERASGELAAVIRQRGIEAEVGAPVIVEGRVWGALIAGTDTAEPLPLGAESRIASFAELIATAVANATSRSELIASRARIVAAADEARRRIERNLHDGTQQRLVSLGLDLQAARTNIPTAQKQTHLALERIGREIEAVLEDVRELSRGLHPGLLAQGGLKPSLRALARKSPIPVQLEVNVGQRPPQSIEIAVYYVVSEALTNTTKHAHASEISVIVTSTGAALRAVIEDNGRGGAEASAGSGLIGLVDRIEALGGRLSIDSPPDQGTRISVELPLAVGPVAEFAPGLIAGHGTIDESLAQETRLSQVADASTLLAAVASVADALYIVDAQGRIKFLNPAALDILGYDDERQLLGRPSHDTIHYIRPDGTPFPAAECPMLRPRVTGETVRVDDDWFVRQDGTMVPVAYSSAPIPLPDGRGAVVSFRDMSDRRRLEDALRERDLEQ